MRPVRPTVALLAALLALADCGDRGGPAATGSDRSAPPRPAAPTLAPEEIDRRIAAYVAARWEIDEDEKARAVVAGGPAAIEALESILRDDGSEGRAEAVTALLARFGPDGYLALSRALGTAAAELAAMALYERAPEWRWTPAADGIVEAAWAARDDADGAALYVIQGAGSAGGRVAERIAAAMLAPEPPEEIDRLAELLLSIGPSAAPAARALAAAVADAPPATAGAAATALAGIGSADPAALPALLRALDVDGERAQLALSVLAQWGDAGDAAVPRAIALAAGDGRVAEQARRVLVANPARRLDTWRALASRTTDGNSWDGDDALRRWLRDADFARVVAAATPDLGPAEACFVLGLLAESAPGAAADAASRCRRSASADVRLAAVRAAAVTAPQDAAPAADDEDPRVRAAAVAAAVGALPAAKVRDVVSQLAATSALDEPETMRDVVRALAAVPRVPGDADLFVRALASDDDEAAAAAAAALADIPDPLPPAMQAHVPALVAAALGENVPVGDVLAFLLRIDGGLDALLDATQAVLRSGRGHDGDFDGALQVVTQLGSRARTLAADLEAAADRAEMEDAARDDIDWCTRIASGDATGAAEFAPDRVIHILPMVLAAGPDGARSLLRALATDPESVLRDVPEVAAAAVREAGHSDAEVRVGCAVAAPSLAPREAAALLARLLGDADAAVRAAAATATVRLAHAAPGAVAIDSLTDVLGDPDCAAAAATALALAGPRAAPAVPALRLLLEPGASDAARSAAIVALARTGEPFAAVAPALRRALASPSIEDGVPWDLVCETAGTMPLGPDEIAALVAGLRRGGPGLRERVGLCAKLGPRAEPAIDVLRRITRYEPGCEMGEDTGAAEALRALGAIGPAARAALPDVRRCLVRSEVADEAARAIARITGATGSAPRGE